MRGPGRRAPFAWALALAVSSAAGAARADVIHLADDDGTIEGRIVAETARTVVIEVERGRIEIDRLKIASIERRPWTPRTAAPAPVSAPVPATPNATATAPPPPGAASLPPASAMPPPAAVTAPPAPATPPPAATDPRVEKILRASFPTTADRARALIDLGPGATPAIAGALGAASDPDQAAALDAALAAYPAAVPAGPLVTALTGRGLAATPALVRAAARHGGPEGVDLALAIMERCARPTAEEAATGAPEALRAAALEGLAEAGDARALDPLLESGAIDLFARCAMRALDAEAASGADAARAALVRAVGRLEGLALVDLLSALGGTTFPGFAHALGRAYERARAGEGAGAADARVAIAETCARLGASGEGGGDPEARRALAAMLDDRDERVRLAATIALGWLGDRLLAPRFIDAYETDPSRAVRIQAHAALVRLAGGRNLGEPDAWRAWWRGE